MIICIPAGPGETTFALNKAYVNLVIDAGFEPIVVSPGNNIPFFVEMCDGVLLPGGIDIDPIHYGENNIGSYAVNPEKDDFERQIFRAFIDAEKPIFGICRGFQLILREYLKEYGDPVFDANAGSLDYYQHIPNHAQTGSNLSLRRDICSHHIKYCAKTLYSDADLKGGESVKGVNSMHHQGVILDLKKQRKVHELTFGNLNIIGISSHGVGEKKPKEYIVEAVEILWEGATVMGVQWHPEELKDVALIKNFFEMGGMGNGLIAEA